MAKEREGLDFFKPPGRHPLSDGNLTFPIPGT